MLGPWIACSLVTFVVVFAVWSLYFSSVVPAGMPSGPWRLRAWYVMHWPLMFGAVGAAAGFSMVMLIPFGDEGTAAIDPDDIEPSSAPVSKSDHGKPDDRAA